MKKALKITAKIFGMIFLWVLNTAIIAFAGAMVMLYLVSKGPSTRIRDLFVTSVRETSAGDFLAEIFLTKEEVQVIAASNMTEMGNAQTDTSLLDFYEKKEETALGDGQENQTSEMLSEETADIEIVDVSGALYNGKMMIIKDPSRVKVGTCGEFSREKSGLTVLEICEKYDAVAGVNGGQYIDVNGFGKGAEPGGIVISEGKLVYGYLYSTYEVYGFDKNNVFVCGTMTAKEALDKGIRDAVTFGPALVINGEASTTTGTGGGLNPRTAIGQRADGSVLLLVIDGRQTSSLGASYQDLIEIMLNFGAVNAANLDGGMSSTMVYEGKEITNNCSIKGPRDMPTAFVVERAEEE